MSLWAIVPVKPFTEGKSRLAACVSPQERDAFNRDLLTRTLDAIRLAQIDAQIVIVSRDGNALAAAERVGYHALAEESRARSTLAAEPETQLNAALTQAARYVVARGATKTLILPTDMPNLTAEDVRAVASPCGGGPQIIIAPSRDGGTNALFLQPAQAIPFAFGRDSFQRHRRLAEDAALPVRVVESASLLFDVDLPEDYREALSSQWPAAARTSDPQAER